MPKANKKNWPKERDAAALKLLGLKGSKKKGKSKKKAKKMKKDKNGTYE